MSDVWDEKRKSDKISLEDYDQTASCDTRASGHHWVIAKNGMSRGKHSWTLKVGRNLRSSGSWQGIGIVSKSILKDSPIKICFLLRI